MKFSEYYHLGLKQNDLDFVDIFIEKDLKLFIDPWAIKECNNTFGSECKSYINTFFDLLIRRISEGKIRLVEDMLSFCHEVKETHLGDSIDSYDGAGMSNKQTKQISDSLKESKAIQTGIIEDIEDCALMIDGINRDKISDMITNIIKLPLIKYTQEQCFLHNIKTLKEVNIGYYWDNFRKDWFSIREKLPVIEIDNKKFPILLVPKRIVRRDSFLKYGEYFDIEILEFEQARHLRAGTSLVRTLKDGSRRGPTKKTLKGEIEKSKITVLEYTKETPELLKKYKNRKREKFEPIKNEEIEHLQDNDEENTNNNIDEKINKLDEINTGKEDAYAYQDLMIGSLETIFYPYLSNPIKEYPLDDRRKIVDIVFQNTANKGFFMDIVRRGITSHKIYFECKNYTPEISNEEIDQLAGRLGVATGKLGILLCRKIEDRLNLLKRCKFIFRNQGSYIICLSDEDIKKLLEFKKNEEIEKIDLFLENKLDEIINEH